MSLSPIILDTSDVARITEEWSAILQADEDISPDKYMSHLSYVRDVVSGSTSDSADKNNVFMGMTDESGKTVAILHLLHARPCSADNGWLKVQSTRFSPDLDLDSSVLTSGDIANKASDVYSSALIESLKFAIECKIGLLKYYAGRQDMQVVLAVAKGINDSAVSAKLGVSAAKKGAWVEIRIG